MVDEKYKDIVLLPALKERFPGEWLSAEKSEGYTGNEGCSKEEEYHHCCLGVVRWSAIDVAKIPITSLLKFPLASASEMQAVFNRSCCGCDGHSARTTDSLLHVLLSSVSILGFDCAKASFRGLLYFSPLCLDVVEAFADQRAELISLLVDVVSSPKFIATKSTSDSTSCSSASTGFEIIRKLGSAELLAAFLKHVGLTSRDDSVAALKRTPLVWLHGILSTLGVFSVSTASTSISASDAEAIRTALPCFLEKIQNPFAWPPASMHQLMADVAVNLDEGTHISPDLLCAAARAGLAMLGSNELENENRRGNFLPRDSKKLVCMFTIIIRAAAECPSAHLDLTRATFAGIAPLLYPADCELSSKLVLQAEEKRKYPRSGRIRDDRSPIYWRCLSLFYTLAECVICPPPSKSKKIDPLRYPTPTCIAKEIEPLKKLLAQKHITESRVVQALNKGLWLPVLTQWQARWRQSPPCKPDQRNKAFPQELESKYAFKDEVRQFLLSPTQSSITVSGDFGGKKSGLPGARLWAEQYQSSNTPHLTASAGGKGKSAYVVITKTKYHHKYQEELQHYHDDVALMTYHNDLVEALGRLSSPEQETATPQVTGPNTPFETAPQLPNIVDLGGGSELLQAGRNDKKRDREEPIEDITIMTDNGAEAV